MTNLTIAIDEDTLREARIEALHRKTSVNRMVAEFLAEIAGKQKRQKEAVRAMRSLLREHATGIEAGKRDELYERGPGVAG